MENEKMTKLEKDFCDLYVLGCEPYGGNATLCYKEVFSDNSKTVSGKARKLILKPEIKEYIDELRCSCEYESSALKIRLTEKLLKIADETSEAQYYDRRGTKLSVAPLRSVAVQACKALMEMYPVREASETNLNINGKESGIVFNVIVPEDKKKNEEIQA